MELDNQTENEMDKCLAQCIHPQAIRSVYAKMPESRALAKLADFYKLFGDGTRIGIIAALSLAELCVCDLCALLDMKQPAISHQLRSLRQGRIVKARREGKVMFYSLSDEHIRNVVRVGLEHLGEAHERAEVA